MELLASVKYPADRKGNTHEDRWLFYIAKRDKQLEKVSDAQLDNPIFRKQHVAHLRKIVEPPALKGSWSRKLTRRASTPIPASTSYGCNWRPNLTRRKLRT